MLGSRRTFLLALSGLLGSGCQPRMTPGGALLGRGKLLHQGRPLNGVVVSLVTRGESTVVAAGVTHPDGGFELRPPQGGSATLAAGEYVVLLEATGGEGWSFPRDYQDPRRSPLALAFSPDAPLVIEVPAGGVLPQFAP